eukprot:1161023-Pelagomonas_calceolata.AAC.10
MPTFPPAYVTSQFVVGTLRAGAAAAPGCCFVHCWTTGAGWQAQKPPPPPPPLRCDSCDYERGVTRRGLQGLWVPEVGALDLACGDSGIGEREVWGPSAQGRYEGEDLRQRAGLRGTVGALVCMAGRCGGRMWGERWE